MKQITMTSWPVAGLFRLNLSRSATAGLLSLGALAGCEDFTSNMPWQKAVPVEQVAPAPRVASSASSNNPHVHTASSPSRPATQAQAPRPPSVSISAGKPSGTSSAAALDTTSAAEKQEALSAPPAAAESNLGKSVVALGAPSEGGLWVESPNVKAPGTGRVIGPNGQSLQVELRPSTGASTMSLGAYQALGIGLTELPEMEIHQ